MDEVTLNPHEMKIAQLVGERYYQPDREDRSFTGDVYDEDYAKKINLDGFLAELAVAKWLGSYPTGFMCDPDGGKATPFDGTVPRIGATYDVKTTRHKNGHLVLPLSFAHTNESDVFIFTTVDPPVLTVAGWIEADKFLTDQYVDYFKSFGLRYVASQEDLQPTHKLISYA